MNLQDQSHPTTYSLQSLLIAMTIASFVLGFYLIVGPVSLLGAFLAMLVFAGAVSHQHHAGNEFWKCIASALIFLGLLVFWSQIHEHGVISFSIAFGIGWLLVCSSILRGHWSTKLLGVFVIIPYLITFCFIVDGSIANLPFPWGYR